MAAGNNAPAPRAPAAARRKATLRARVILATCLLGVAMNLFIAFVWVPRLQNILRTFATEDTRRQAEVTGASLVPFLLSNELSGVYQTLNGVLEKQPSWRSLTLTDPTGRQLFPLAPVPHVGSPGVARISVHIRFQGRTIGTLSATIDLHQQLARIDREGTKLAATLTLLVTALLAGFIVFLETRVTRPVHQLAEAAQALRRGDFDVAVPDSPLRDIDELSQSFKGMRQDLLTTQQGLVEARKAAEATADLKTRILSTMSHEMRTPLNGILGMADLLQGTPLSPEQGDYAKTIHELGSTLLWQIEDLLSAARFEATGIVPRYAAVDINDIVGVTIRNIRPLAQENGTQIRFTPIAADQANFLSDAGFLHHIVQNLLSNATKFTHDGAITVSITREPDSDHIRLCVADTGPGIAPEVIDRIFDDFVSVSPDPSRLQKGTGLGLGIVRRMVEALKGEIHVDSRTGAGAQFTVTLPAERVETPAPLGERIHEDEVLARVLARAPMQPPRILVAEDNPTNMMILVKLFGSMGFAVDQAGDGQIGLRKTRAQPYFLIVTDQQMPAMSGRQMLDRIRSDAENPNVATPVVLVSANTYPDAEEAGHRFDAILVKPVRREAFIGCLSKIFDVRSSATPPQPSPQADAPRLVTPETEAELIEIFGAEVTAAWQQDFEAAMTSLLAQPTVEAVRREISSALSLGFPQLAEALRSMEDALRAGDGARIDAAKTALRDTWDRTRAARQAQV